MYKRLLTLFLILFLTTLVGCGTTSGSGPNEETNFFDGYVYEVKENEFLVTENRVDEKDDMDLESGFAERAGNAIYFDASEIGISQLEGLKFGDYIRVEHDAVAESYPGQSKAYSIEELDEDDE
ncbi:DUF3221 domain-containing protein [Halalkalibacillus halophilus]|uniref:DUF3221 domain-containing protein n=1 Tax=Halalkalibacillus halophilus TaxID=392827 RepID=UPI0003F9E3A7|nr:DUF3221 domain-containing protein [Halalkalibacillus halophilus]